MNERTLLWLCQKAGIDPGEFLGHNFYEQFSSSRFDFKGFKCQIYKRKVYRNGRLKSKKVIQPPQELMEIQKRIRDRILRNFIDDAEIGFFYAHGGFKEHSIITHTQPHAGNRFFFVFDLRKAYPSVRTYHLEECLKNIGFYPDVVNTLIELNTYQDRLPIGFPASPLLFNLVLNVADNRIAYLLRNSSDLFPEWGFTFTRFFDDFIVSSPFEIPFEIRERIKLVLAEWGFKLHPKKTFYLDVTKKAAQTVGLTITDHGIVLSKKRRRNMEGILWLAIRDPFKWRSKVYGKLGLFRMVYGHDLPKRIDMLFQEFEAAYADAWRKEKGIPLLN